MSGATIKLAETADDFEAARALCREWLDWHWRHYPDDWPQGPDHPMAPERFLAMVEDLENIHKRPRGGVLLGEVDGRPVGCVMYNEAGEDVAEFNRMYVSEAGRGHGLGRLMLDRMFEEMITGGYRRVLFSSANFLTHAQAMYRAAGFSDMAHPDGFPAEWRDKIYFMERALV